MRLAITKEIFSEEPSKDTTTTIATLGGGCFWCLDAVFRDTKGVRSVLSGYMGGDTLNPTYQMVCSGETGHAEVVRVEFDPQVISYREILEIFFTIHDPTTLNRQGHDVGTQYRSVIFTHDSDQENWAKKTILDASGTLPTPVVTQVVPVTIFYPAEPYHQDYYTENSGQPYCQGVVRPKVEKFRTVFPRLSEKKRS